MLPFRIAALLLATALLLGCGSGGTAPEPYNPPEPDPPPEEEVPPEEEPPEEEPPEEEPPEEEPPSQLELPTQVEPPAQAEPPEEDPPPEQDPPPEEEPPPVVPDAPENLSAIKVGSKQVILSWDGVDDAESYHIYYASDSEFDINNIYDSEDGTWLQDVSSPATIGLLENNRPYYFVVTAIIGEEESDPSDQVDARPRELEPTANEVRMIELINRARFNPEAEVDRQANVSSLNEGTDICEGTGISPEQKTPLAFNQLLRDSAENHSHWMLANNIFSHTGVDGSNPWDRMETAGYTDWALAGENLIVSADLVGGIDGQHNKLFESPSHRCAMLHEDFRELGVGQDFGPYTYPQGTFDSSIIAQNYGTLEGDGYFITGVIYQDDNSDGIYDQDEGLSGITVNVNATGDGSGVSQLAFDSGIYSVAVSDDTSYTVTLSGDALPDDVMEEVHIDGRNIKLDAVVSDGQVTAVIW